MKPLFNRVLGLLITAICVRRSLLAECVTLGQSPMPLSASKYQLTHSVEYRTERAWTSNDRKGWKRTSVVEYLRFVCKSKEKAVHTTGLD
jgi:hypothetical protein